MANKKYHYYVLVFTNDGPKYVTGILPHHMAEYDKTKKPLELAREVAEDIYTGLCLNFINANLVRSRFRMVQSWTVLIF